MGGQNSQDSILERRSLVWNDDNIEDGTVPDNIYEAEIYKGKFFTRGCRGMIEQLQLYCIGDDVDEITLRYSPHPCLGPIGEVALVPAAAWAWQAFDIEEMWNYDSLFIWVHECEANVDWAYDAVEPYDGHEYTVTALPFEDLGETWEDIAIRPFIRVVYAGETPGDVPVSGIINIIPIPSSSSESATIDKLFVLGAQRLVVEVEGAGYCDYIKVIVRAAADSHETWIYVYCDDVQAFREVFDEASGEGHTTSTPTVSIPLYAEDGECVMLIHKRFEFRRRLQVRSYSAGANYTLTVRVHPTLMR